MKGICLGCKRQLVFCTTKGTIYATCSLFNGDFDLSVTECSHFEEKQDTKDKPKAEAKQTANKGKYPRKQPKKKEESAVGMRTEKRV